MAAFNCFYYEDMDDVEFDKDVIISYWLSKGCYNPLPQYLASKAANFMETGTMF